MSRSTHPASRQSRYRISPDHDGWLPSLAPVRPGGLSQGLGGGVATSSRPASMGRGNRIELPSGALALRLALGFDQPRRDSRRHRLVQVARFTRKAQRTPGRRLPNGVLDAIPADALCGVQAQSSPRPPYSAECGLRRIAVALSFNAQTATGVRSEIGGWADKAWPPQAGLGSV